jgi:hypothetical protein
MPLQRGESIRRRHWLLHSWSRTLLATAARSRVVATNLPRLNMANAGNFSGEIILPGQDFRQELAKRQSGENFTL